jgi:hypothetical protein
MIRMVVRVSVKQVHHRASQQQQVGQQTQRVRPMFTKCEKYGNDRQGGGEVGPLPIPRHVDHLADFQSRKAQVSSLSAIWAFRLRQME